jgi:hypothetical protein
MSRSGADLALLLLGGFRTLVDAAIVELARRGYEDVRPVHDFAMRAIAAGADSASELGRRLSISKQSAAKTIAVLQQRGYRSRRSCALLRWAAGPLCSSARRWTCPDYAGSQAASLSA